MDWKEFVSSLIGALAWPATILLVILIFRSSISKLLSGQVKRWKAGPGGIEFEYWERAISDAREHLLRGRDRTTLRPEVAIQFEAEMQKLAEVSPETAVLESYGRIEAALRTRLQTQDSDLQSTLQLARTAAERGLINAETLNAIEGLTVLRNLAAHGRAGELTPQRALEFAALSEAVLFAMRQVPKADQP